MNPLRLLLLVLLLSAIPATAQNYIYQVGSQPFSTQIPVSGGFINVNNGDVHIEIPLAQTAQRGDLPLNESLVYDSRIWKIVPTGSSYSWQPTNVPGSLGGWTFQAGPGSSNLLPILEGSANVRCDDDAAGRPVQYYGYQWTDPIGTTHRFNVQWQAYPKVCEQGQDSPEQTSGTAIDASGYTVALSGSLYGLPTTKQVFDKAGNQVYPTVQDRNGNTMTTDANGNLVDTVGRTPVLMTTNGNQTTYSVLGVGGVRNQYVVTTQTVAFNTKFSEQAVAEGSGSFTAIQSIQLPDKSMYTFGYDSGTSSGTYGELTSVTLPTGGVIQYGYANFLDSYSNQNRWINSVVQDGGTTSFAPSTISSCTSSAGCQEKMKVTSPAGNDTVYTFSLDKSSYANAGSWVTGIAVYQGTASSGALLRSTSTQYSYATQTLSYGPTSSASYLVPSTLTSTLTLNDVGQSSMEQTAYDAQGVNPISVKDWNFYTGSAPSTPTTETDLTYGYGFNGASFVTQSVTKDGSGNQISKKTYNYDENQSSAGANLTSEHDWINTSGSTYDTSMVYDNHGVVTSSTSPNGTTKYSYDSNDLYQTSIAEPTPSSGVALTVGTGYDASTGTLTSRTDENGQSIAYKSPDVFNRPQEIDNPDGGIIQLAYTPTQASVAAENSSTGWTINGYDAYGRLIRANAATGNSSNPWYMQDTCYNGSGQVKFQSYRFQGQFSQSPVCSGAGDSYAYDALGRVTQVTHGDGSNIVSAYTGRAVKTTDENGASKITQTDAYGQVTAVCEISNNGSMPGSGTPGSCGTDIAGTGFVTTYSYNLASHTTTVTQGSQTRTFQTDSLGRAISTQEPESGTTSWTYSYNSTGLLITRSKPTANQANASVQTTTKTQYDSLGRPISIVYSDSTPAKYFDYDTQAGWGRAQTNVKGRLQRASSAIAGNLAATIFSYDAMGRISFTGQCQPSGCYNGAKDKYTPYTWDYAGNMLTAGDGAGTTITMGYTPAQEVTGITSSVSDATHPGTLLSNVANGPFGPAAFTYGNGLTGVQRYDGLGRLNGGFICSGSSSTFCSGGTQLYGYTTIQSGSRMIQTCDSVVGCANTTYDDMNRLTALKSTSGSTVADSWTYDRYGNRWSQNSGSVSYNTANNQEGGFSYDVAGNVVNDKVSGIGHTYTYDAEGNVTQVDGGSTATYYYDALNRRVRSVIGSNAYEYVFDLSSNRVSIWNGSTGALLEEKTYWGSMPLDFNINNALHFAYQDWLGTARLTTSYSGAKEGSYTSMLFGDGLAASGADADPYHFAMLDHDYESGQDHAQYREYASSQGRWNSPDPYSGSYDWSSPQSLNRYSYVGNNPLSLTDPTGQFAYCGVTASSDGGLAVAGPAGWAALGACIGYDIWKLFEFFDRPSFHGSLKPRPNAQPWDEYNIHYGANIAGALGLPDQTCEFGACGGDFLKNTPISEDTTMASKIKQLASLGITYGAFETKHSPFHKGQLTFRDNRMFCSTHVVLDKGSGENGQPVTGSYHKDFFNPWKELENPFLHTICDLVPDEIESYIPSFPTASDLCSQ